VAAWLVASLLASPASAAVGQGPGQGDDALEWRLEHLAGIMPAQARDFFATLRRGLGLEL